MKTLEIANAVSFKNILFLTDFTPASRAAFSYAVALARHFGARLYPAHAVVPFVPTELDAPVVPDVLTMMEAGKKAQLTDLVERTGLPNTILVTQKAIEDAVPRWINEHGIDLIVMGTHGRKGVDRIFLGSTAEAIVRTAACPVLTVGPAVALHGAGELEIKKILFATDFSDCAKTAQEYAASFASQYRAELHVLYVMPDIALMMPDPGTSLSLPQNYLVEQKNDAAAANATAGVVRNARRSTVSSYRRIGAHGGRDVAGLFHR